MDLLRYEDQVRVNGVEWGGLARDRNKIDAALNGEMAFRELGRKAVGVTKLGNLLCRRNW